MRSLSLSHGVARGGKVAFEISDKKPLFVSPARTAKMKRDETKERGLVPI